MYAEMGASKEEVGTHSSMGSLEPCSHRLSPSPTLWEVYPGELR